MPLTTLVAATSSAHKVRELSELFPGVSFERIALVPPDETGTDFLQNALIKARAYWNACRRPVLADDSGLCVNALYGAPGLYSARWGTEDYGRELNDTEKNALLIQKLQSVSDRSAYYVCAMVLMMEPEVFYTVQTTWKGIILEAPRGAGGFGYDPVFQPLGETRSSAELKPEEKNRLSHRGQAASLINKLIF